MSECEVAKVYRYCEPVARKPHVCCECAAPILTGERHFCGWGVWSTGRATYRQHLDCMEACMLIRDEFNGDECIGFGELFEFWGEMRDDVRRQLKQSDAGCRLRDLMARILRRQRASAGGSG